LVSNALLRGGVKVINWVGGKEETKEEEKLAGTTRRAEKGKKREQQNVLQLLQDQG